MEKLWVNTIDANDKAYMIDYSELDYDFAKDFFEKLGPDYKMGACSVIHLGNFIGRKLDWFYNYDGVFVVRTPDTTGVAGGYSAASVQQMENGLTEDIKKIIPFFLQDGFNKYGLFAELNVVPNIGNKETHPEHQTDRICSLMIVRYILDHYKTIEEAIEGLQHIQIYNPKMILESDYETHFFLAQDDRSVVLEIVDGQIVVVDSNKMTNFHQYNVTFNEDGSVYTPVDAKYGRLPSSQGVEPHGDGLERWNIMNAGVVNCKEDMTALMKSIDYSQAYTLPADETFWYSEFVGKSPDTGLDITVDTPYDDPDFQARIAKYKHFWETKDRSTGTVWNSSHTSVYDLKNKILYLNVQEYNTEYEIHMFEPKLAEIKAMKNGMYEIPEGYDGIKSINVAVPADYSSIYYYHKWIVSENDRILDIGNTVYIDKPTSVIYGNSPMLTIDGNRHEIDFTQICDDNNYDITISLGEKFDVTCSEEDCAVGLDTFTVFIPENKTGKNRSLTVYINHKMRGTSIIYKCVTTFTQKSL